MTRAYTFLQACDADLEMRDYDPNKPSPALPGK